MAGPTVGILVKDKLDGCAKEKILAFIQSVASEVRGDDFWVSGAPLGYTLGPEYPEEIDEYYGLNSLIGWSPKDIIGLYAMCNGERDHLVLGRVALGIAKIVNGKIAFRDLLSRYTEDSEILNHPDCFEYENESIISAKLFERWLEHKNFYMVK